MSKYRNLYYVLSQQKKKHEKSVYLTMQSDTQFQFRIYNNTKNWEGILEYSLDTINWVTFTGTSVTSTVDGTMYLRGTGNTKIAGSANRQFVFTNATNLKITGNIETLLDWQLVMQGVSPVMATYCYSRMFQGCTTLTTAPEFPATTLAAYCYSRIFLGCTSLTTAPELPATTLATYCYSGIFNGCTSLKVSTTQTEETFKKWRIPSVGEITTTQSGWNTGMLTETGGTFKSNPTENTTYYISE